MKKNEIAISITILLITAVILIWIFFGFRIFSFGQTTYPHNVEPPSKNATLFEKMEWEKHHGSICQCSIPLKFSGPIVLHPTSTTTIGNISFNLSWSLDQGMPFNMTNAQFTLSTKDEERSVWFEDSSAVTVFWIRPVPNQSSTMLMSRDDLLHVDLNCEKMGFTTSPLHPNERFSLIVTPKDGYPLGVTLGAPPEFLSGAPIEISIRN